MTDEATNHTKQARERIERVLALAEQPIVVNVADNTSPGAPDQSFDDDDLRALLDATRLAVGDETEADVERVARALQAVNWHSPRGTPDGELDWRLHGSRYLRDAKAAINAVRKAETKATQKDAG